LKAVKNILPALLWLATVLPLVAQQNSVVNQPTEWFALNSNIKLTKKFGFAFDGQLRFAKEFESAQHYVRNGIEFYLKPNLSIVPIGYMYVWNFRYGDQPASFANNEQRIWQQLLYRHSIKKFAFNHRLRMEERFIETRHSQNGEVIYDGYNSYLNRIRYRLQIQLTLNKDKIEPGAWFASMFDEIFYSWGSSVTYTSPDQNRIYLAIGYQFNKQCSLQGGAFYQALIKKNGTQEENNIGTLIQFTYNLDFSKKSEQ
jgi:hypothetical protein